jgi:hypothetical protein
VAYLDGVLGRGTRYDETALEAHETFAERLNWDSTARELVRLMKEAI